MYNASGLAKIITESINTLYVVISDNGSDDCFGEDEIWGDASDDDVNHGTALSREWEWRHNRFHTVS